MMFCENCYVIGRALDRVVMYNDVCTNIFCLLQSCIQRAFKAEVYTCPSCRFDLGKDNKLPINKPLSEALLAMLPGYGAGR